MIDMEPLKYIASLGVGGAIAVIIFVAYRKDAIQWQKAWQGQSEMLVQVVKENTAAVTALVEKLDNRDDDGRWPDTERRNRR